MPALACAVVWAFGCSGGGGAASAHSVPGCEAAEERPLLDGSGDFICARVGGDRGATEPDVTGASGPVVYVTEGATGGDGSMGAPFGRVREALDAGAATIVLNPGMHAIDSPLEVTSEVALVGAGDASAIELAAGMEGLVVHGMGARLSLIQLSVTGAADACVVARDQATLELRDVTIRACRLGVSSTASEATLTRVTIEGSTAEAVDLSDASRASIAESLIHGGEQGIVVRASTIDARRTVIEDNRRDGLALLGASAAPSTLDTLTLARNGVTGMRLEDGASAVAHLVAVYETRTPEGLVGGDGVYVATGASLDLDAEIASDAMRGHGSFIVGNARTGALVSGASSRATIAGALVGSNAGPGVFVQDRALIDSIGYSIVDDNGALGLGAASLGGIAAIPCNLITGTRDVTLRTTVGELSLGDGLSLAEGGAHAEIHGNDLSDNARFGAIFAGADATLRDNSGAGNAFGVGTFGGAVDLDGSNSIMGRRATPSTPPPTARGQLDPTISP